MNGRRLENGLIEHCAPTLAGMKCAGLFRYFYDDRNEAVKEIEEINGLLNQRGVYVEALRWDDNAVLIYTYRLNQVQKELNDPEVMDLLASYGYPGNDAGSCIRYLEGRLYRAGCCFPHEIGVFLGYPLEDVKGFIANGGRNCKCCGLWKVYCNEKEKLQLFHKLKRCSEIYLQVFSEGRDLVQMTVCA